MFQLVGLGEQAGSGFPKIYKNWNEQHWKNPELEERFASNQTVLVLRMSSLLPEDVVSNLRKSFGKTFDQLDQLERIALVTAKAEGCVTHRRLIELSKDHPSELTRVLHGLVDKQILKSEGAGKGTFYYLAGEHPIKGDIVQGSDDARNAAGSGNSEHSVGNSEHLDSKNSEHLDSKNSEHLEKLQQIAKRITGTKKSPKSLVSQTILDLCQITALSISEMARLLSRKEDSLRNHYINLLCGQGVLKRQYPNILNHPKQKYYTVKSN